jgi:hypothetical protein
MTSSAVNGQPAAEAASTTLQTGVASYGGRYTRPRGRRPASSTTAGTLRGRRPAASATAGALALATALALSACTGPSSPGADAGRDERVVVQPDTPFDPLDAPADTQPDTPADADPALPSDPDTDPPADRDPEPPADPDPPADADPDPAPESRIRLGTAANRDKSRFGEVAAGDTATRSFNVLVENADPAATVDADVTGDAAFALAGTTCDPATGERRECRIDVTFAPRGSGARTGTLTVSLDGAAPASLALTGQVAPETAPVDLESTPSPSTGA